MEGSLRTPELDTRASTESKPETQASKRRKVIQKTVVTVKIEGNGGKQKNEGPPSDFWSWRKYGQKPIKGSPYPRGYYRCSTSKGCSAKKQVERCRTDASLLLITYTSSHNHPDPDPQNTTNLIQQHPKEPQTKPIEEIPTTPNQEQEPSPPPAPPPAPPSSNNMNMVGSDEETVLSEDHFHYLQSSSKDMIIINPFTVVDHLEDENSHELLGLVFDEEPISYPHLMTSSFSTPTKSEENDFFDELEELPITSSSFNSFMRSSLFDERVILQPS